MHNGQRLRSLGERVEGLGATGVMRVLRTLGGGRVSQKGGTAVGDLERGNEGDQGPVKDGDNHKRGGLVPRWKRMVKGAVPRTKVVEGMESPLVGSHRMGGRVKEVPDIGMTKRNIAGRREESKAKDRDQNRLGGGWGIFQK
ncbi:unnamed protein product [Ectocarpus sp. CCAP 1310/34]|nr:unnamed protein product [Ectocarpus sp. CCAP 1310/34]